MEAKHQIRSRAIFLFSLTFAALVLRGQNLEIPEKEFVLALSVQQLEVSRGEKGEIEILILRSKKYEKRHAKMGVSSRLPKGVTISYSPDKGNSDSSIANISVQSDAIPGRYMVILNATLNNKTKGMILKLLID